MRFATVLSDDDPLFQSFIRTADDHAAAWRALKRHTLRRYRARTTSAKLRAMASAYIPVSLYPYALGWFQGVASSLRS